MTEEELRSALALEGRYKLVVWKGMEGWVAAIKGTERTLWITFLRATGDTEEDAIRHVGIQYQNEVGQLTPYYPSQQNLI